MTTETSLDGFKKLSKDIEATIIRGNEYAITFERKNCFIEIEDTSNPDVTFKLQHSFTHFKGKLYSNFWLRTKKITSNQDVMRPSNSSFRARDFVDKVWNGVKGGVLESEADSATVQKPVGILAYWTGQEEYTAGEATNYSTFLEKFDVNSYLDAFGPVPSVPAYLPMVVAAAELTPSHQMFTSLGLVPVDYEFTFDDQRKLENIKIAYEVSVQSDKNELEPPKNENGVSKIGSTILNILKGLVNR